MTKIVLDYDPDSGNIYIPAGHDDGITLIGNHPNLDLNCELVRHDNVCGLDIEVDIPERVLGSILPEPKTGKIEGFHGPRHMKPSDIINLKCNGFEASEIIDMFKEGLL